MRAQEFIIEYKLKVSRDADGVAVQATAGGKNLGHAEFFFDDEGRLDPQTVWVDERFHGQGIARDMYDHLKELGYTIVRSWDQTDAGRGFWNKHRGEDARVWEQELSEISRDRLERYLSRATRQVDSRQERMARARERLSRSYEIYHADEPTKIVDRFEADTSADAQRYYQDYIEHYESDRDYDLRLRRATGIMEGLYDANPATYDLPRRPLNVPELIKRGAIFITEPHGDNGWEPDAEGFSLITLYNVAKGGWPAEATQHLKPSMYRAAATGLNRQGPGTMLYDGKYRQILWSIKKLGIPDEVAFLDKQAVAEFAPSPERDHNDDVPDPVFVLANRWWNSAEKQPQIESVLNSMGWSIQQVESEDDAVQLQHRDGTTYFISADDFDPDVFENFADGKKPGRKGLAKRVGVNCKQPVSKLRSIAKNSTGERQRMAHWCANMKSGRKK